MCHSPGTSSTIREQPGNGVSLSVEFLNLRVMVGDDSMGRSQTGHGRPVTLDNAEKGDALAGKTRPEKNFRKSLGAVRPSEME